MKAAQDVLKRMKSLKAKVSEFRALEMMHGDALTLAELGLDEGDDSVYAEAKDAAEAFKDSYEKHRITALLGGEYDGYNAILSLHPGAGGTEA